MIRAFKKLWNDDRGNTLILFAASLPVLIGCAGLATDTIEWALWKRQLQRAADSAALAGVYTRIGTDTQTAVTTAVTNDLAINYKVDQPLATGYPVVSRPSDNGTRQKQVQVTLRTSHALPFSRMFMRYTPNITATATAASVPGAGTFCVLATDTSAGVSGITITGSATLDIGTCSLMADSSNPTAAATNGNNGNGGSGSRVTAASLAAVGGVNYSGQWNVADYDPNSPAIADPFASKRAPTSSECSKTVTDDMTKNQSYPMDRTTGTNADTAGQIVCFSGPANKKGLSINGSLKLQSGVTYVIDGGDLTMNSTSSSLSCTGCTIVLTNFTTPAQTGNVKITGGTLSLVAPTSATSTTAALDYKGIAIFQDRRATDNGGASAENKINGNNGASVTGAVYIANRALEYNGGSSTVYPCLMIVSKRVTFSGNSAMKVTDQCAGAGLTPLGGGRRVRLVA